MTTRKTFEQELTKLNKSLEEMGKFVENSIDKLVGAMEKKDMEQVRSIIKSDRDVNDMERSIEAECLSLITRQQPIARDLRVVSAALKVVTDIERIGDHAVDVAELFLRCENVDLTEISAHLPAMIAAAKDMVHHAIDAFVSKSVQAAEDVISSDDVVDELFNKIKYDIVNNLKKEKDNVDCCIDLMMITKYLEKIGDHAVNIAEWEIFKETGSIDKVRLL